jgi:hypothetical protein
MTIHEIRQYVNKTMEREYTREQIIIGMDYAGFRRVEERYCVIVYDSPSAL